MPKRFLKGWSAIYKSNDLLKQDYAKDKYYLILKILPLWKNHVLRNGCYQGLVIYLQKGSLLVETQQLIMLNIWVFVEDLKSGHQKANKENKAISTCQTHHLNLFTFKDKVVILLPSFYNCQLLENWNIFYWFI